MCEVSFHQKSGLLQHISGVHEKAKPFPCLQCDKVFPRAENLKIHIGLVHEEKKLLPFSCSVCDMEFARKYQMVRHMKRKHKNVVKRVEDDKFEFVSCQNESTTEFQQEEMVYDDYGGK